MKDCKYVDDSDDHYVVCEDKTATSHNIHYIRIPDGDPDNAIYVTKRIV